MKKARHGFTIIEVSLVLCIAGLIFLMAFIALPSLWSSQRDAARKANIMAFVSDIKNYQTNNSRGALPTLSGAAEELYWDSLDPSQKETTWTGFIRDYVKPGKNDFTDASGNSYIFYIVKCTSSPTAPCTDGKLGDRHINEDVSKLKGVDNTIYVVIGATCEGDQAVKANSNRSVAALYVLERSGRYCYNT